MQGFNAKGERIISPDAPLDEFGLPLNPKCPHINAVGSATIEYETFPSAAELGSLAGNAGAQGDWATEVFLDSLKRTTSPKVTTIGGKE